MPVIEGRTSLEILPDEECRRLLREQQLGRVGVLVDGHPEIFPVNYALDGDAVVLRVDAGAKLDAARTSPLVAFEIDGSDAERRGGWSVLVVGPIEEVSDQEELARLEAKGLEPWADIVRLRWLRIVPDKVTGRRIWHRHKMAVDTPNA